MEQLYATLAQWEAAKKALEVAKETEMTLREQIAKMAFPNPTEGTQHLELDDGWSIKLVYKMNYSLADNERVDAALTRISNLGQEGKFIAERLVSWKPALSLSEYRELDPQYKGVIDEVLTIKPAAPTLEIKPPKAAK